MTDIHVMGPYWQADRIEPTALGVMVASAKDEADEPARRQLMAYLTEFTRSLALPANCLVAPVPPGPDRVAHPVPDLAAAVGAALGVETTSVVARHHATPRLRDTPAERRRAVVEAAGYHVIADVTGRSVVLVDDVILTGTTIAHLAELLLGAGADRVDAVVVARTRRAG